MEISLGATATADMWAILPGWVDRVVAIDWDSLARLEAAAVSAGGLEAAAKRPVRSSGATAIVPVSGVLKQKASLFERLFFGASSYQDIADTIDAAVGDARIKSIVLDVDSPGGTVAGATELAAHIREAAARKPITAHVQHLAASAAYWLISGASEIAVSPSAEVGSVGALIIRKDVTGALENEGIKLHVISAGKYKLDNFDGLALDDAAIARIQTRVNGAYDTMIADIAAGRNVKAGEVRNGYGEGALVDASTAVRDGMADRIATRAQVLARHGGSESGGEAAAQTTDQSRLARLWEIALTKDTAPAEPAERK